MSLTVRAGPAARSALARAGVSRGEATKAFLDTREKSQMLTRPGRPYLWMGAFEARQAAEHVLRQRRGSVKGNADKKATAKVSPSPAKPVVASRESSKVRSEDITHGLGRDFRRKTRPHAYFYASADLGTNASICSTQSSSSHPTERRRTDEGYDDLMALFVPAQDNFSNAIHSGPNNLRTLVQRAAKAAAALSANKDIAQQPGSLAVDFLLSSVEEEHTHLTFSGVRPLLETELAVLSVGGVSADVSLDRSTGLPVSRSRLHLGLAVDAARVGDAEAAALLQGVVRLLGAGQGTLF